MSQVSGGSLSTKIPSGNQQQVAEYSTRIVPFSPELGEIIPIWKRLNQRYSNDLLDCDPEWLLEERRGEESKILLFLLEKHDQIVGVVPFEKSNKPHYFKLGEARVLRLPFKSFRLLGYSLSIPPDAEAHNAIIRGIAQSVGDFDGLYMGHVEVESFLWNYLHSSSLVKEHFRCYSAVEPQIHPLIRFRGTFDDYMRKFSPQDRRKRFQQVRRLKGQSQVEMVRFTEPAKVGELLDTVFRVSGNTWQFQIHGRAWAFRAADLEVWRHRLEFAAERGWLRSYVLKCDGTPWAFILGFQHSSRFYPVSLGFDQARARYSVGTVLQFLVLEDLFRDSPPELYDFGTFFEYKAHLANESYLEQRIALFPRRPYPLLIQGLDYAWHLGVHQVAFLLDRMHIKSGARRAVRTMARTMKHG